MSLPLPETGHLRAIIEGVYPEIDGGTFAIKRTIDEKVVVEADIFVDGHDALSALLLYRHETTPEWSEVPMTFLVNDRWYAEFTVTERGIYSYTLLAWPDRFKSWNRDMRKRVDARQDVTVDLLIGADLIEAASQRASGADARQLAAWSEAMRQKGDPVQKITLAFNPALMEMMDRYADRRFATRYQRELRVLVQRKKAYFSAWYELFPRSCSPVPGKHGTFKDCEHRLAYIASMGFDVVYLPPIHPIGTTFRKGKNNALTAEPGDVGSPWAIGSPEGGHKAVHPQLGTLQDFRHFVKTAREQYDIDIALDIAFQCSPDHPYVKQHPEWFRKRPDGTIQYAENPPKKYQDIYPFDFETDDWERLWKELRSVFLFWIEQGVQIFRVDNPHTKSFRFWEWVIADIKKLYPDVIFLSEAFTRPKVMYKLAKIGFTQSYTYFAWRNDKHGLTEYFTELTKTIVSEFFRPNPWPNTPDILNEYLQHGGRPAFQIRLVLAATLAASYGIYGPAYELCINTPREPGSEEYLNSEKYELRHWDLDSPQSLRYYITRINQIRHENAALHSNQTLEFHYVDNDQILFYSKCTDDLKNIILVVVTMDPFATQWGWAEVPLERFKFDKHLPYRVRDLLNDTEYVWQGEWNYVELRPHEMPAHIFRLEPLFEH
jgi:starch synthase (maltosyl-transferring)